MAYLRVTRLRNDASIIIASKRLPLAEAKKQLAAIAELPSEMGLQADSQPDEMRFELTTEEGILVGKPVRCTISTGMSAIIMLDQGARILSDAYTAAELERLYTEVSLGTTVIRKIKRSKGFARWSAYEVDHDQFGRWLFTPPGSLFRAEVNGVISECEVGQGTRAAGLAVLHLIPLSGWWMAQWTADGAHAFISVEVCTPPAHVAGEWHFVDLELDPYRGADGCVRVDDEDEFVAACDAGLIVPGEAVAARAAAAEIASWLADGLEPFGQVGWTKLHDAINRGFAPLTSLPPAAPA